MIKGLTLINRHEFPHLDKLITKCLNKHGLPLVTNPLINTLIHSINDERRNSNYLSIFLYVLTSVEDIRQGLVYKCKGVGLVE